MGHATSSDPNAFILPDLGEGVHEAELISWKVAVGDTVEEHQTLAEMETDKALVEVPSPRAGVIASADVGMSGTVATSIAACRLTEERLDAVGSALLSQQTPLSQQSADDAPEEHNAHDTNAPDSVVAVSAAFEAKVMAAIEQASSVDETPTVAAASNSPLPSCLSSLLPAGDTKQLDWKRLSTSLKVARLPAGDPKREIALHKIKPGGSVANHDHRGREVTVVLTGSFSDQNGLYLPGDFLVKEPGEAHRPMASEDTECICLSVMDAPVKFTGVVSRLINPFLRIKPMSA